MLYPLDILYILVLQVSSIKLSHAKQVLPRD